MSSSLFKTCQQIKHIFIIYLLKVIDYQILFIHKIWSSKAFKSWYSVKYNQPIKLICHLTKQQNQTLFCYMDGFGFK